MREGPLKSFIRAAAPLLLLLAAEMLVSLGFAWIYYSRVMEETGASADDPSSFEAVLDRYMEYIKENALMIILVVAVIVIVFSVFLLRNDEKRHRYRVLYGTIPVPAYITAVIMGAAACIGMNLLLYVTGIFSALEGDAASVSAVYTGSVPLQIAAVCIASPLMEEIVFRNLFYKRLRDYMSFWPSCIISSLAFAVYHGNLLQGFYAFITGLMLAYVFEKTDFLPVPFLCHAAANTVSYILTYTLKEMPGTGAAWAGIAICAAACAAGIFYFKKRVQVQYELKETSA